MSSDSAAPGWYPVDNHTLRWWDGAQWTDLTQPRAAHDIAGSALPYGPYHQGPYGPGPYQPGPSALVICGYIFAVICPLVGFILGIVAWTRLNPAEQRHGRWIVLISVILMVVVVIWAIVVFSDVNHQIQTLNRY